MAFQETVEDGEVPDEPALLPEKVLPLQAVPDGSDAFLEGPAQYVVQFGIAISHSFSRDPALAEYVASEAGFADMADGSVRLPTGEKRTFKWWRTLAFRVAVPTSLTLRNRVGQFSEQFKGVLRLINVNIVYAHLSYSKIENAPVDDLAQAFLDNANARLVEFSNALDRAIRSGADLRGGWIIAGKPDNSRAWDFLWPQDTGAGLISPSVASALGIVPPGGSLFDPAGTGGPIGPLEGLIGFFREFARWLPWIIIGLILVAAFLILPHIILALVQAMRAWGDVGALV